MADTGRIYLFRKNMVRPGWGNHALKRGRRHTSPPRTTILERFPEQLNTHSEQLNATMCHHDTILVAFTLGSDHELCSIGNILRVPLKEEWYPGLKDCRVLEYDTEQQVAGNQVEKPARLLAYPSGSTSSKLPSEGCAFFGAYFSVPHRYIVSISYLFFLSLSGY